jgi:hypothetical protein
MVWTVTVAAAKAINEIVTEREFSYMAMVLRVKSPVEEIFSDRLYSKREKQAITFHKS